MECYYHPNRESTDNCAICGKSVCKECGLEIGGNIYCKECLEKIVGLNLAANQAPQQPKSEPARLAKKEVVEEPLIEKANLSYEEPPAFNRAEAIEEPPAFNRAEAIEETPQESQILNQRVAEDSPYNIKDSIQYEGGIGSTTTEEYKPQESPNQAMETSQIIPERPVENVREEFIPKEEPITQARNEYDTLTKPQAPPEDDYIYPDHSYQPEETSARKAVEDKYAAYLDDLYFDEEEVPLNEQLARDEEKYGSLTMNEYQPRDIPEPKPSAEDDLERRIREELMRKEKGKTEPVNEKIHNIDYADEKEPFGAIDIVLTAILVIVIIIVLFYIVYLFKLSATYPTFLDALYGLKNPGAFFNALVG